MKKRLSSWCLKIAKYLEKLAAEFQKNDGANNNSKDNYVSLTPLEDLSHDDGKEYFDALSWALKSNDIKNIALTGPYGSGKSSILLSFQKKHPEYDFLHISLATFGNLEKGNSQQVVENGVGVDSHLIERSILQQIFYKKRGTDIPESKYARRSVISDWKLILITIAIAIWILALFQIMDIGFPNQPKVITEFITSHSNMLNLTCYTFVVIGIGFALFKLMRLARNLSFQKIKIASSNIEVEAAERRSPLNENVDELLYFFEVTKYKGLIIEDLDRFKSTDVFNRLRELNLLINRSEQIKLKPIVFIYGIKDDLFIEGDRTKFFDFIIPVVPVVSSSNAGDKLFQMLEEANLSSRLQLDYVFRIGQYITDMRMVRNIFNEFLIYKGKFKNAPDDKLLGMIVYKNLYPSDFSDLHDGRGIIYEAFGSKEKVVRELATKLETQIAEATLEIEKFEKDIVQNIIELNTVYLAKIREHILSARYIHVAGETIPISEMSKAENFDLLLNRRFNYSGDTSERNSPVSLEEIENEVDPDRSYRERRKIIQEKETVDLADKKNKLAIMREELEHLKGYSLKELLNDHIPEVFSKELKNHGLLVYLLQYGAIDEQYELYIANFYEGVLRKEDQLFLIAIKNGEKWAFDYPLVNCGELLRRLSLEEFRRSTILNIALVNFMLENQNVYAYQLNLILKQLSTGASDSWLFFDQYFIKSVDKEYKFIRFLASSWNDFWLRCMSFYKERGEDLLTIFSIILNTLSFEALKPLDKEKILRNYCEENYFRIASDCDGNGLKNLQNVISNFGLKIEKLEGTRESLALQFLVENNAYRLSGGNITHLLAQFSDYKLKERSDGTFLFSDVLHCNCDNLIDYFFIDLEYSINILLENISDDKEHSEAAIKLLNRNDLSLDIRQRFINKVQFSLADIGEIDDQIGEDGLAEIYKSLLRNFRIEANWDNMVESFDMLGMVEELELFINAEYLVLSQEFPVFSVYSPEEFQRLMLGIIKSPKISENSFRCLKQFITAIPVEDFSAIPVERLKNYIDDGLFNFDQSHLDALSAVSNSVAEYFLKKNIKGVGHGDNEIIYNAEHLSFLLFETSRLGDFPPTLLNRITYSLILESESLADAIATLIIEGRPLAIENSLIAAVLESSIPEEKKISLFLGAEKNRNIDPIEDLLSPLGDAYRRVYSRYTDFEVGELDERILTYLKELGFIADYNIQDGRIKIVYTEE